MRKTLLLGTMLAIATAFAAEAFADTYVRGHYRKDGTYVQPHYRSSPNGSYNDNWSVSPNVNPHTGRQGTRSPTWDNRPPPSNSLGGPSGSLGNYGTRQRRY